jgi:hypothetical protein
MIRVALNGILVDIFFKLNIKMVERAKVDTSNTYIHDPMNVFAYSLQLLRFHVLFIIDITSFK